MKFIFSGKNRDNGAAKENGSAEGHAKEEDDQPSLRTIKERLRYASELVMGVALLITFSWYLAYSLMQGKDNCQLLLEEGNWDGDSWKPKACKVHAYSTSEIEICLRNSKASFIGDSGLHRLYQALKEKLNNSSTMALGGEKNTTAYTDSQLRIELEFLRIPESREEQELQLKAWRKAKIRVPSLAICSFGEMEVIKEGNQSLKTYREHLKQNKEFLEKLSNIQRKMVIGKSQPRLVWKPEEPVEMSVRDGNRSSQANKIIQAVNDAARAVMKSINVRFLEASYEMAMTRIEPPNNQYSSNITNAEVDLILNLFCNRLIQPKDATCCKEVEGPFRYQYSAITILASCMLLFIVLTFWSRKTG